MLVKGWTRRGAVLCAVAALLAVAALVVVVGQERDDRQRARVGEVIDDYYVDEDNITVDQARVALPYGYIDVEVSKPRDDMRLYDASDETFGPPEDGSFVEVLAQVEPDGAFAARPIAEQTMPAPELVLRDGDREYPVERLGESLMMVGGPESANVAIAGHPDDLVLDVVYDGVTQTVDLADGSVEKGRAAPLYDLPTIDQDDRFPDLSRPCGRPRWSKGFTARYHAIDPRCQVSVTRLPYDATAGWAEEGRTWLSVTVTNDSRPSFVNRRHPDHYYEETSMRVGLSLDGGPVVRPSPVTATALFAVPVDRPGGTLAVSQDAQAYAKTYDAPRRVEFGRSWTIDLSDPRFGSEGQGA